ncbi:MAG: Chaperone for flagella basal body P-ring formation [Pseudomonadota bacterium]
MTKNWIQAVSLIVGLVSWAARAQDTPEQILEAALRQHFSADRAEILSVLEPRGALPFDRVLHAEVLSENASGEARLLVRGYRAGDSEAGKSEVRVKHATWVRGWSPKRKISPGEALSSELFELREFNIGEGLVHEYRGALLSPQAELHHLEAKNTLVPGSFVSSSAVRRIPDLRRGDVITLQLVSGGVRLTTSGTALESSSVDQNVRVQATKSKREFVGKLLTGQRVEVML